MCRDNISLHNLDKRETQPNLIYFVVGLLQVEKGGFIKKTVQTTKRSSFKKR